MIETSASDLREHLAEYLDRVEGDAEVLIVHRRDHPDLAIVDAAELRSLQETAHVFSSTVNARRLVEALERAEAGVPGTPVTLDELRSWISTLRGGQLPPPIAPRLPRSA